MSVSKAKKQSTKAKELDFTKCSPAAKYCPFPSTDEGCMICLESFHDQEPINLSTPVLTRGCLQLFGTSSANKPLPNAFMCVECCLKLYEHAAKHGQFPKDPITRLPFPHLMYGDELHTVFSKAYQNRASNLDAILSKLRLRCREAKALRHHRRSRRRKAKRQRRYSNERYRTGL